MKEGTKTTTNSMKFRAIGDFVIRTISDITLTPQKISLDSFLVDLSIDTKVLNDILLELEDVLGLPLEKGNLKDFKTVHDIVQHMYEMHDQLKNK